MLKRHPMIFVAAVAVLAVLGLAACGGDDDNSSSDNGTTAAASTGASGGGGITTQSIAGTGTVLVDSTGMALYTNDMDKGSKIACTGECITEWIPVTGAATSGDSAVQSKLGTVKRSDGSSQVTFDGLPLYTFVDDTPGQVTGNGESDSFGGTTFTWTVASTSGSAAAPTTTSGSSSGGGSSGGGYGY